MTHAAASAMTLGLMLIATPSSAAVVVQPNQAGEAQTIFAANDRSVPALMPDQPVGGDTVTVIGDTFATYAAMLPMPSEWILLVTGFAVIGYTMRSRKRARVSFN